MQKVAAYLLEQVDQNTTPAGRRRMAQEVCGRVEDWLRSKGAIEPGRGGVYQALDGSDARFDVERAEDGARSWTMYSLEEVSETGRRFVTRISVTAGLTKVYVYGTLEVGDLQTRISPINVDPRCPRLIRDLLACSQGWFHGSTRLLPLTRIAGFSAGTRLAEELIDPDRRVPFLVVSVDRGHAALPGLAEKLAYDLAGLANVYAVDPGATWALTDSLGKVFSCYQGAIRLYWPRFSTDDQPFRHPLWTARRLLELSDDAGMARERIRKHLRGIVMRASARSTVRPSEIDEIRDAPVRARMQALRERLESSHRDATEWEEMATLIDEENARLRREVAERDAEIGALQQEITQLTAKVEALQHHLREARPDASLRDIEGDEDAVVPDLPEIDQVPPPRRGEIRFYKKTAAAPMHDVMIRVDDCGHRAWQSAGKADKAKKGIAKLEGGRRDWSSIQHCGRCTGGGLWRVRW